MTIPEAQAFAIFIAACVAGFGGLSTTIISIIVSIQNKRIHTLVNSAMTQKEAELTLMRSLLVGKQMEIDVAEKARLALASALVELNKSQAIAPATPLPVVITGTDAPVPVSVIEQVPPSQSGPTR